MCVSVLRLRRSTLPATPFRFNIANIHITLDNLDVRVHCAFACVSTVHIYALFSFRSSSHRTRSLMRLYNLLVHSVSFAPFVYFAVPQLGGFYYRLNITPTRFPSLFRLFLTLSRFVYASRDPDNTSRF